MDKLIQAIKKSETSCRRTHFAGIVNRNSDSRYQNDNGQHLIDGEEEPPLVGNNIKIPL